jgi:hypothetical protein
MSCIVVKDMCSYPSFTYRAPDANLFVTKRRFRGEVLANRPDIIVTNKERTCLLIDVEMPSDRNVTQNKAENNIN